ncbi:alpha/beta fold hydrolase [Microbacterium horticulturae]|uniref:Alpha/beta fold hydrolase n=1 Tax=Microbacterium horticulturae TaxID=3028316 RepID=A0ABY8C1B9_9MICO|nr:alpha/beta fold hydrolase [Microbacterium sp. KACC 23027]WEG10244.1 alpha/beta fold hydrolase [Microbacterium sp. KACC 23027]
MDVILVPGLWLDASSWDGVVPALERAGHTPHALTMPGVGEPVSAAAHVGFEDWVATVVAEIDKCDSLVAIVGHSGGGNVAWAAADARPEHVSQVIFVDSVPPASGFGISEFPALDGVVPFPGWDYFDGADIADLDDEMRDAVSLRSVPMRVPTDAVELSNPARRDIPVTLLSGRQDEIALRNELARWAPWEDELTGIRDVEVVHLDTGHWPQLSEPEALAVAIVRSLERARPDEAVSEVQGRILPD